jgi:hypothetical protein
MGQIEKPNLTDMGVGKIDANGRDSHTAFAIPIGGGTHQMMHDRQTQKPEAP